MSRDLYKDVRMGFKKTDSNLQGELKTVKEIESFISSESNILSNFASSIKSELEELNHLKYNFDVIKAHVLSFEKQVQYKADLLHHFHKESSARVINIDNLRKIIALLKRTESYLNDFANSLLSEIQKLIIDQGHVLYSQSDKNRKIMDVMDKEARDVKARVVHLARSYGVSFDELNRVESHLVLLERERSRQEPSRAGF
jgi:hypothetical protein